MQLYPFGPGLLALLRDITSRRIAEEQQNKLEKLESLGLLAPVTVLLGLLTLTAVVPYELQHPFAIGATETSPGLLPSDALLGAAMLRAVLLLPQTPIDKRRAIVIGLTLAFLAVCLVQTVHGLRIGANLSVVGGEMAIITSRARMRSRTGEPAGSATWGAYSVPASDRIIVKSKAASCPDTTASTSAPASPAASAIKRSRRPRISLGGPTPATWPSLIDTTVVASRATSASECET